MESRQTLKNQVIELQEALDKSTKDLSEAKNAYDKAVKGPSTEVVEKIAKKKAEAVKLKIQIKW